MIPWAMMIVKQVAKPRDIVYNGPINPVRRSPAMKKTVIVNIYNFIRKSHVEPSEFIIDDFETIRNQLILMKQYGLPGTYALKHDALIDPTYQALLKDYLDENDEIFETEKINPKTGKVEYWVAQQVVYDLGKVI